MKPKFILTLLLCAFSFTMYSQVASDTTYPTYILSLKTEVFSDTFFRQRETSLRTSSRISKCVVKDELNDYSRLKIKSKYKKDIVKVKLKRATNGLAFKTKYSLVNNQLVAYKLKARPYDKSQNGLLFGANLSGLNIKFGRVQKQYLGRMKTRYIKDYDDFKGKGRLVKNRYEVQLPAVENLILFDTNIKILFPDLK